MQDRHIGGVRVTRIEEQMGPGFPAKDFFPEFDADTFAAEGHWLAPSYYQPESGRLMTSIHSWLLRTGKHTILVVNQTFAPFSQTVNVQADATHKIKYKFTK